MKFIPSQALCCWYLLMLLCGSPCEAQTSTPATTPKSNSPTAIQVYNLLKGLGFAGAEEREDTIYLSIVGDSITSGLGLTDPNRDALAGALEKALGPDWDVTGFGRPGATAQTSTDLPYSGAGEFGKSLLSQADVLLIMLGTNDCKPWNWKGEERFLLEYEQLIHAYQGLPFAPDIWLCLPPPIFAPMGGITAAAFQSNVIPAIEKLAEEMELPLIDLNTPFRYQSELFPDGIHPDRKGAQALAKSITPLLEAGEDAIWSSKENRQAEREAAAKEAGERVKD